MPSFDIVSKLDMQEVDNAVNQVRKEVITRYDFKGSDTTLALDKEGILLKSSDDFKVKALVELLREKAVKRGISPKALDIGKIEPTDAGRAKCLVKLVQGIDTDRGRELVKKIKDLKLKVQASVNDDQIRVSGKKKDDLQTVIGNLRGSDFPLPLQFVNFRD